MSLLAAMASYSNLKQKILVSKEFEPPIKEVSMVSLLFPLHSKKKVKKRSRPIDVASPTQDSSREKFSTAGADERTTIDISLDEAETGVPNSGLDLVEQLRAQGSGLLAHGDTLIGSKAENILLQKLVSTKPPQYVIAQRCFTKIFEACVGYAYTMDNEHKKVVELAEKLEAIEDRDVAAKD
ncbi:uncharacterized protein LOC115714729 [Cannabis sativa]|uniref:uncharacterized protein LOC115714729 n=1 Tax=Cannabis sativa TaxID=3483 RepID=UPI0029C9F500|nr:uncharacterized protein LOC115714729 [Cannabis sativa]